MPDSDLDYAFTTGRLGIAAGDGPDDGDNPDIIWCNEGKVTFIPEQTITKVSAAGGGPATLGQANIVADIDNDGHITYNGKRGVWLVDLTSEKINPVIAEGATHRVEFSGVKANGVAVAFPPVRLRLTRHGDGDGEDNANDITRLMPVNPGASTPIVVGPAGVSVARLETTPDGKLAYTLSDGTEEIAGDLPVGPGGSNEGVAGYIAGDGPTKTALSAALAQGVAPIIPPLVASALATDPTIAEQAAALAQSDAGLARGTDPGMPRAVAADTDEWAEVLTDDSGRVASGTRADGTTYTARLEVSELMGVEHRYADPREGDGEWVEVITDAEGRIAWGIRADGTVRVGRLDSPGITLDDAATQALRTRMGQALRGIVGFGDSMTQGVGSSTTTYPSALAAAIQNAVPVINRGVSGQTSSEVALRTGALEILVTVTGRAIPPSGPVAVTVIPAGTWRSAWTWTFPGSLAGVPGNLVKATDGSWTFTRAAAGDAVTVPPQEPFKSSQQPPAMTGVIYWAGRNNVDVNINPRDLRAVATQVRRLGAPFLVLPVFNAQNEPSGSAGYTNVATVNARYEEIAGADYFDARRWIIAHGLEAAGITPTAADTTAVAEDRIPPSLMADNLHLNASGYQALGAKLANIITRKGWLA
ncbi:SGNH/GDSL hydrolase family protein [Nocardioides ochotonae]|uniref:SGNH/GDSL hydrolase family protein n=1 Tax=Nocardioides ochotonae TaxID=2685869 RepID=UPI00140E8F86|nr:GDSL-type esterase/lipase family protein [Nocardioides ochotonae]